MSSIVETIKAELEAFNKKRESLVEQLRQDFPALLKPLFEKYPEVKRVSWTQYAPYFNDGEECIFSVHNDDINLNGKDSNGYDNGYDDEDEEESTEIPVSVYEEFIEILTSVPDEFYEDLFGNHVEVTVKSDGTIDVDSYEHD